MKLSSSFFLTATRLSLGFVFLWAFLDKTFGFGFATAPSAAWISGGSPTSGFLGNAVQGPFAEFFQSLSGLPWVDWLFMLGLFGVGVTFIVNRYVRFSSYAGALMLILMYLALLWPENNPLIDDHIVYAFAILYIGSRS
jgi:thiosulfate dehydrogenase [quinone] large subunit